MSNIVNIERNDKEHKLDITVNGEYFASYVYDPVFAKPYFGPVMMPNGLSITRLDFSAVEHPHQRSIFIAVGDVSCGNEHNVDFWNEPAGHGVERHTGFDSVISDGSDTVSFTANNVWRSANGVPMLDDKRLFTVKAEGGDRIVDVMITFKASYGDVEFGNTKEAGPFAIRMADNMRADHGGRITNSEGGDQEAGCWGKCAEWCRYSGVLNGLKCSVTVYDDPRNERYPTAWHCRDYGLFAANNLYFKGGLKIPSGESLIYRFKVLISSENS